MYVQPDLIQYGASCWLSRLRNVPVNSSCTGHETWLHWASTFHLQVQCSRIHVNDRTQRERNVRWEDDLLREFYTNADDVWLASIRDVRSRAARKQRSTPDPGMVHQGGNKLRTYAMFQIKVCF